MRLLALDTATEACSAALAIGDEVRERWVEAPREHGDRLLAMLDELLDEAGIVAGDLDALAFGRGPGAFTGVRIATGVAQGIAFGLDLPVLRISTLATLAQGAARAYSAGRVVPAIDARMGEVYWGAYMQDAEGVMRPALEEEVSAPERVALPQGTGWYGTGSGWRTHGGALAARLGTALERDLGHALPHAADMIPLARAAWTAGEAVTAAEAVPVYLRDRVAEKPGPRPR